MLENKKLCKCGCGEEIVIKKYHKYYGVPEYILGHNMFGKHPSPEAKRKMSEAKIGKNHSPEAKRKMSEAKIGKNHSPETKRKMSEAKIGKNHSPEAKRKMSEAKIGENHPNWQGGISFGNYCEKWNDELREEIRKKYNYRCFLCDKSQEEQICEMKKRMKRPQVLHVHHVDADKGQGCGGKKWNLVPLCNQCHGKAQHNTVIYDNIITKLKNNISMCVAIKPEDFAVSCE